MSSQVSPVMAWKNQPSDFFRRTDLDDAPLAPIGLGEFAQLVNAIDDSLQDAAVPAARLAVAADAIARVPARGRRLPTAFSPSCRLRRYPDRPRVFAARAAGLYGFRSACGPAARTGARASPVWERSRGRWRRVARGRLPFLALSSSLRTCPLSPTPRVRATTLRRSGRDHRPPASPASGPRSITQSPT